MLAVAVKSAGLAACSTRCSACTTTRRYKTDPAAYALGPAAFGCRRARSCSSAATAGTRIGATWFGYTTLWVNRTGAPLDPLGTEPSRTGRSLRDVLDFFPLPSHATTPPTGPPTAERSDPLEENPMRTLIHRLHVATRAVPLHRGRGAARHRRRRLPPSGPVSTPSCTTWRRRTPRCWPSATACRPSWTPGTRPTRGPIRNMRKYRAFLQKIGYLVPVPAKVKVTTKNVDAELALQAGPAAGGADHQRALCAECGQCALGLAVRRALRHRRDLPEADGARKGSGYNPMRGAKVIEYARHVLDRCAPLTQGSHLDATAYRVVDNKLAVTLKDGSTRGPEEPGAVRRLPGRDRRAVGGAAVAPRPAHGHPHRPRAPDRRHRPGRRVRPGAGVGAVDHPRPGGFGGRGRRRRQGAGLPQLARHPAGHAHRSRSPRAARPSPAA